MAFRFFNPNPKGRFVGDCTIRAICKFLHQDWDSVYAATTFQGFLYKDMPSGNSTWGAYLYKLGFKRAFIPDNCLGWYSVKDFCRDHPVGSFLLVLDQIEEVHLDGSCRRHERLICNGESLGEVLQGSLLLNTGSEG